MTNETLLHKFYLYLHTFHYEINLIGFTFPILTFIYPWIVFLFEPAFQLYFLESANNFQLQYYPIYSLWSIAGQTFQGFNIACLHCFCLNLSTSAEMVLIIFYCENYAPLAQIYLLGYARDSCRTGIDAPFVRNGAFTLVLQIIARIMYVKSVFIFEIKKMYLLAYYCP